MTRTTLRRASIRALPTAGALPLGALTGCGADSSSGNDLLSGTPDAAQAAASADVTDGLAQDGARSIPGATRGYTHVPDKNATSGAAVSTVVVGERGLSVALTAAQPVTSAQAQALGAELVSAPR